MLKRQSLLYVGCLLSVLAVSACSNKVLPEGKRVAVLSSTEAVKPVSAAEAANIDISGTVVTDWLQNEANSQHVMPNAKVSSDFSKEWKADFGTGSSKREILMSKPLIKGQTVYTLDAEGMLSAFELSTGKNLWRVELVPENNYTGSNALKGIGLAIEGNTVYITTGFGVVVAANAKDGSKIWERNLRMPLRIAPVATSSKVFVQSVDNHFYALNAKTGEIMWTYDIAMENTTVVGGAMAAYNTTLDMVVTGFSNGEIQAFGATIGTPLWSESLIDNRYIYSSTYLHPIKASPIVDGEKLYALGSADALAAIDMRTGKRLWEKKIGGTLTPLLSGNTLFVITNNNELLAVNKQNGDVLWNSKLDLGEKPSKITVYAPIMLNDRVIVALSDGNVLAYNPKNGKLINKVDLDEDLNSAPVAGQGYILFTTSNAKLIAYK